MGITCATMQHCAVQDDQEGSEEAAILYPQAILDMTLHMTRRNPPCFPLGSARLEPASFTRVAECFSPLLFEIGSYLAGSSKAAGQQGGSPLDLARVFCCTSRTLKEEAAFAMNSLWEQAYKIRWPAFHQAVCFHSQQQDWSKVYHETQMGRCECTLEVFDREKKPGFAMAAMPARVQFKAKLNGYIARYISASPVRPELIPMSESHRVRFCPSSVRDHLQPYGATMSPDATSTFSHDSRAPDAFWSSKIPRQFHGDTSSTSEYPYRVLEGTQGLEVGRGVELQWKMQEHSPFGWWYGILEGLRTERDHNGERAVATIIFCHFPKNSLWYRVDVRFGDGRMHPCTFGGTTGGVRAVSPEDDALWRRFFPKELVLA